MDMEFLTVVYAYEYGVSIKSARKLNEDEKSHYNPEMVDYIFIGTGKAIELPELTWKDMPSRPADGEFVGYGNRAYVITAEEAEAYVNLNRELEAGEAAQEAEDEIEEVKAAIVAAEKQTDIPTAAEAAKRMKAYNDAVNEGGYGYVPHIYSREEHETLKRRLEKLEAIATWR